MIIVKTERELDVMRQACGVARLVLQDVAAFIQPGVTTREVDEFAAGRIEQHGAKSAFLGYRRYPSNICISVNDEVVHGLAGPRQLRFGDIVSLDVGVFYRGFVGDNATTVAVGGCSAEAQHLMDVTNAALYQGIAQAIPGRRVVDISRAIQTYVERHGYSVVREFVGHGVGRSVHEKPEVPNFVDGKSSPRLKPGMTLAIEPMVNAGGAAIKVLSDGWTAVTQDGSLSAHFEHTVLVAANGPEIMTCPPRVPGESKALS